MGRPKIWRKWPGHCGLVAVKTGYAQRPRDDPCLPCSAQSGGRMTAHGQKSLGFRTGQPCWDLIPGISKAAVLVSFVLVFHLISVLVQLF